MNAPGLLPSCFERRRGFAPGIEIAPILAGEWEQRTIRIFGRECPVPRLTAWYGEAAYTYSGIRNAPASMPAWLQALRVRVQDATGARFNSALLNYYRDGRDSVAWHSDDEPELGDQPTIASLSIGASRSFSIRTLDASTRRSLWRKWSIKLSDGDLLIMRGESQADYQHAVPKTSASVGPRINITLRWIGT